MNQYYGYTALPASSQGSRKTIGLGLLLALGMCSLPGLADYPEKPVRFIVPYSAGGPVEGTIRIFSKSVGELLGQPLIIEAKPGANTVIGTDYVAKSPPDGYTMLIMSPAHAASPALLGKLPYDSINDFAPVTLLTSTTFMLMTSPNLPVNSIKELLVLAKRKPAELNFGIGGAGTPGHLTAAYFNNLAGIKVTYIPFKGAAPAYVALAGGHIDLLFSSTNGALPLVRSGRVKALAVSGLKRAAVASDVPTVAEAGFPGFESTQWVGVMARAKTPKAFIDRLYTAFAEALRTSEVQKLMAAQGLDPGGLSPDEFGRYYRSEVAKWTKVIADTGIKAE